MADDDHDLGWIDPVGLLVAMEFALTKLAGGKAKYQERMQEATRAFVGVRLEEFPSRLHKRAASVLGTPEKVRVEVRVDDGTISHCRFQKLTRRERAAYAEDLLCLYRACVMDLVKLTGDDHYPSDR